jgi:hypothetical protein
VQGHQGGGALFRFELVALIHAQADAIASPTSKALFRISSISAGVL